MIREILFLSKLVLFAIVAMVISSCSNIGTHAEYAAGTARPTSDLTVPPGLTAPDASSSYKMLSTSNLNEGYRLNSIKDMKIEQGGSERWLVIKNKTVNQVWPMMLAYLNQTGLEVKYQNKAIGSIQTGWTTRNNVVPETGIRKFFDWVGWGSMYSLKSQYMFRVNLWQNENNTQVFVTDYQMDEVYPGCAKYLNQSIRVYSSDTQIPYWMPIPPDPRLELEFLLRFMAFAGLSPEQVKHVKAEVKAVAASPQTKMAKLQGDSLVINDSFDRAWWRSGLALERAGLGVADKNRSTGEYYVYPLQSQVDNPDPGVIARWFGTDKNTLKQVKPEYTVKLTPSGNQTILTIGIYQGATVKDFAKHQKKYLQDLLKQLQ
jgi:outer membrane protein assembly factor BamC